MAKINKINFFTKVGIVIMFLIFMGMSLYGGIKSLILWQQGKGVLYGLCDHPSLCPDVVFTFPKWKVDFISTFNIFEFMFMLPLFITSILYILFLAFINPNIKLIKLNEGNKFSRLITFFWVSPLLLIVVYKFLRIFF